MFGHDQLTVTKQIITTAVKLPLQKKKSTYFPLACSAFNPFRVLLDWVIEFLEIRAVVLPALMTICLCCPVLQ